MVEFETRKIHNATQIVTPSGEIKQRDNKMIKITSEGIEQLAIGMGATKEYGVYWVEQGNDLVILIDAGIKLIDFQWQEKYDTIRVIGNLHSNIRFKYAKCNLLDLSELDTSDVTDMSNMFKETGRESETLTIDVSNFDTSKVTNMSSMFYGMTGLTNLDVSNFNTSKVTDIQAMFLNCTNLKLLNISNWDTSKITNMRASFNGCRSLTTVDIANWNVSNVENMNYLFQMCLSLENIDLSKWDVSSVTTMRGMFNRCIKLTNSNNTPNSGV